MIRFKQFLFITEEKIEKFVNIKDVEGSHEGRLDPNNPVHQQMARLYGNIPKDRRKIVDQDTGKEIHMKNPQDIKSFRHFHQLVNPEIEAEATTNQHRNEDKEAFQSGEAKLVHHDPSSGAKVYEVNSAAGSCAAIASDGKDDTKWCTGIRGNQNMFDYYHDGGNSGKKSFVIHLPKEKDKNLQKIGIYGVKPWDLNSVSQGMGGNFQKKDNTEVSNDEWSNITKKYNLGDVKELRGIRGTGIEKEDVDKVLKGDNISKKIAAIQMHPGFNEHHIQKILDQHESNDQRAHNNWNTTSFYDLQKEAIRHPKATDQQLTDVISGKHYPDEDDRDSRVGLIKSALENPNIRPHHIDQVMNKTELENDRLRVMAMQHPSASSSQIEKGLKDPSFAVQEAAIKNKNPTSEQLSRILHAPKPEPDEIADKSLGSGLKKIKTEDNEWNRMKLKMHAAEHPNLSSEDLDKVIGMNGPPLDTMITKYGLKNPNLKPYHIDRVLSGDGEYNGVEQAQAMAHPTAVTPKHIEHMIKHGGPEQAIQALEHPNVSADNITQGLNHYSPAVNSAAAVHPKANSEHLTRILKDPNILKSPWMRDRIFNNPNLEQSHLQTAMSSSIPGMRIEAVEHPKSTKEMFGAALNDTPAVIKAALDIGHHAATGDQLTDLLNHPDASVASHAVRHGLLRDTLEPKHIKQILDNPGMTMRKLPHSDEVAIHVSEAIKKSPKLLNGIGPEYASKLNDLGTGSFDRAVGGYSSGDLASIARTHYHRTATVDHIDRALGTNGHQPDPDPVIRGFAITHPKVQQRHVDKVLGMHGAPQDATEGVRKLALTGEDGYHHDWKPDNWKHPSPNHDHLIKSEHIDKVLGLNGNQPDDHGIVRQAAIDHKNTTNEQLMKATNDERQTISQHAIHTLKKRGVDIVAQAKKDLQQRGILRDNMKEAYRTRIKRFSHYTGRVQ